MNLQEIENAIAKNTKKDLKSLAIKINDLIEDFAHEKGLNYNYLHFKNDSYILNKLAKLEGDDSTTENLKFYSKMNSKYENSLGDCEKVFFEMLEDSFFECLHKKKVENLIKKASLLDD
tara:strand:+ start:276 stop:632 length:357 start_codon:yes stop_codon:yes gene_type:complete